MNNSSRSATGGEQASEQAAAVPRHMHLFIPAGEPHARAQEGAATLGELGERETLLQVVLSKSFRSRWQDKNFGIFFME